jgi:ankyrin repeat protein
MKPQSMLLRWWIVPVLWLMAVSSANAERRLVDAVKLADTAAVRALLEERVDVNAAQEDGTTALHWAADGDDREIVALLIRAGANVKAANR